MGAKESRIGFLSYDEAIKRVTDVELKRLKDAFKRTSGLSCYMNQQCFYREVLGDAVPPKVAEVIYSSFGGTAKGLHFNNLIVGLVLLTRGRDEEKAKYIFSLFANESGSYAMREDMESMLRAVDGEVPPSLRKCFTEGEKVNYEKFKNWLLQNKEAFTFSRWLLSGGVCVTLTDDSDTPTFYQTLAGVTHLEESDIIDLEKRYWLLKAQSGTGRFDLETFVPLVSPPIHASLSEACCRGPVAERQKFCFKVFDVDRDGVLSRGEIHDMVIALLEVWKDNRTDSIPMFFSQHLHIPIKNITTGGDQDGVQPPSQYPVQSGTLQNTHRTISSGLLLGPSVDKRFLLPSVSPHNAMGSTHFHVLSYNLFQELHASVSDIVEGILKMHDTTKMGHLTLEDYQIWSVKSALANEFLNLLFQVCHIVLGLRPATPEEEGQIIRGWLERESRHGLQPGQNWFLISMQWWQQWKDYVKYDNQSVVGEQPSVFGGGRGQHGRAVVTPTSDRVGIPNSHSAAEERLSDNVSSASEASENNSSLISSSSPATDCFPRPHYHNVSDNNNQCFPGANGNVLNLLAPQRPGAIDNQPLVTPEPMKAPTLTMEGGRLRRSPNLLAGRDFETVPEPVWRALYHWYGANLSLPRPPASRAPQSATIKDIHEYLSQRLRIKDEDMRLWLYNSENYLTLLDDEDHTLESLKIQDEQHLVIEVRNKDMSWPEEMSFIANSSKIDRHKVPTEKGATGLSNLGNTCFMNSSIQCVSNTKPLTEYFISGRHLYELNRTNPIGMRGHMAKCYGDLVQELWSGTQKNVAPLKLRWTIAKYAPRFNGFQQQDSQELLAFLLDGLHEDLNRVHEKPYAWENHLRRNRSIVVDLFHGQLKSQVKCKTCGHISARFDPFNFLSLPLPMDSSMHLEITVIKLDGSTPVRFGLRLNMDEKYTGLKRQLSELCSLKPEQILLAEVHSSNIKNFPLDNQKVRLSVNGFLCAFEIPVPGSPTSVSSPMQTDGPALPNGTAGITANGTAGKPSLIPNGLQNAVAPCGTDRSLPNGIPNGHLLPTQDSPFIGYIIAMHRKMMRTELYFLSSQKNRPSLFGMPLIVPCTVHTRKRDLYDAVWIQVSRLASPLPPQEASNHAQDCDDSLGYQYPFTLRVVQKDGNSSALGNAYIAVDWDPTALHLRYQTSQERVRGTKREMERWSERKTNGRDKENEGQRHGRERESIVEEHCSVEQSRRAQAEPISLDSCLRAFTSEEELGEDELYYCSKCHAHRLATKKLDLWRLPPILSQKIVKFPREKFDPSAFLAPREAEQHQQNQGEGSGEEPAKLGGGDVGNAIPLSPLPSLTSNVKGSGRKSNRTNSPCGSPRGGARKQGRLRLPQLGSRHRLSNSKENLDCSRDSSSTTETEQGGTDSVAQEAWSSEASSTDCDVIMVNGLGPDSGHSNGHTDTTCHSGILGGGHYVTYAKNPNEKWYCYNDSSCKEVHSEEIDTDSAYILFYEQQGVDYSQFLPKTDGKKMADTSSMDEDFESDYKKYCVLQ
ncbi:hypothetical protein JZ751_021379 [Albula glossodonta]|uniref:ubiquitinyl hydrolase 1 n=1 Tax=Albula glossodonta TaxID=121402 RepID=A0A8T2NVZ0_9TELE|nr:hypothetical protein JZ751_021379 [Albula glossodonta]